MPTVARSGRNWTRRHGGQPGDVDPVSAEPGDREPGNMGPGDTRLLRVEPSDAEPGDTGPARAEPTDTEPEAMDPGRGVTLPAANLCNGTALRKATRRVSMLYDSMLAPCGMRSTQRSILIHIARAGSPTMGELAAALVLDRSALAHNLKPLERDGLIAVIADARDRRSRLVSLTPRGAARLEASTQLWHEAQARFETAFGAERSAALRGALALIASDQFADAFKEADRR